MTGNGKGVIPRKHVLRWAAYAAVFGLAAGAFVTWQYLAAIS